MELRELENQEAQEWDRLIVPYPGRAIFHQRAWLEYLAASQGVDVRHWSIQLEGQTVGYFCGGLLRKGPFRILGSPLKGWGTNFMGPLMSESVERPAFFTALDRLAKRYRLAMVELEQRMVPEDLLQEMGYESETSWTYLVELTPGDPDAMLRRMHKSRRYGIRRAIKLGLSVEDTDDPRVADEYYDQFLALMQGKGMVPTYPREYPRLCFQHLRRAGRLFALRVRDPRGQVIATGLFPFDDHTVYFWGGASRPEARQLYANDLMHWHVMSLAAERGLRRYDMSGWGRFKEEFGGQLVTLKRWHKCFSRSARLGRRGYRWYVREQFRVRGWFEILRGQFAPAVRALHRSGREAIPGIGSHLDQSIAIREVRGTPNDSNTALKRTIIGEAL